MKHKINWSKVILYSLFVILALIYTLFYVLIIDYLLGLFWNKILVIFICFLLLVFSIYIFMYIFKLFSEIYNHKKVFNVFKKRKSTDSNQILFSALNEIQYELEIEKVKNGVNIKIEGLEDIILIRTVDGKGLLVGKRYDRIWNLDNKEIENPFSNSGICYLVRNFNISYVLDDIFVGTISEIVFKLENKIMNLNNRKLQK